MTESKICTCPSGNGSLRHPCPAHPASVEQAGGDERAAFEAWLAQAMSKKFEPEFDLAKYEDSGEYRYSPAAAYWKAWQARAALAQPSDEVVVTKNESGAIVSVTRQDKEGRVLSVIAESQPSPAQAEQAEAERPIVSFEKYMQVMYDRDENAKRLDAALARIAELEAKLSDPTAVHQWQFSNAWFDGSEEVVLKAGKEGSPIRTLYAAPVAQAQHSVPGDIMRDAQRYRWLRDQQFYFSFSTENSDAGISSCTAGMSSRFKNLSWVDAAIDSAIAAAPGKEVGHE